jgi:RND superfamily putative drug exporter
VKKPGGEPCRSPGWERLAALVGRRPAAVLLAGTLMLIVPALGMFRIEGSLDIPSELPPEAGARRGFESLARHYPGGAMAPVSLVVCDDRGVNDDERLAAVDRLTTVLRGSGGWPRCGRSPSPPASP